MRGVKYAITAMIAVLPMIAAAWDPFLSKQEFQELSQFERAQYEKARKLFEAEKYTQAANEFDKFALQFEDSAYVGAVIFLKGYSLMYGLKRNTAIKVFYEMLDFFPDDMRYAPAAMYYIGHAHTLNGNRRDGLKAWQQFVKHPKYKSDPLAAPALKSLADNAFKNKNAAAGNRYLSQIYADFFKSNKKEAVQARDRLVDSYIREGDYSRMEKLVAKHDWKSPRSERAYFSYVWDRAFHSAFPKLYVKAEEKRKAKDMKEFFDYWRRGQSVYGEDGKTDYLNRAFQFSLVRMGDKAVWEPICDAYVRVAGTEKLIQGIMIQLIGQGFEAKALKLADRLTTDAAVKAVIATLISKAKYDGAMPLIEKIKAKDEFYPWFFDQLLKKQQHDLAAHILAKINDQSLHQWKKFELKRALKQWKECIGILKDISGNDEKRGRLANWELAKVYHQRTRQYDDAIKIYQLINEPPASVWPIAECYKAKGDMRRGAATYSEIENFFPNHAPQAALRRAELYRHFGDTKKAIAEYRRIGKVYKTAPESSRAHQRLEEYGVKTGGGETR